MKRLLLLLVLLVPNPVQAQSVTMPKSLTVPVGRLAVVDITYDGKDFRYAVIGTDADAFREYTDTPNAIRLRILPYTAGQITVVGYCAKGNMSSPVALCVITVGNAPPVPPGPTDSIFQAAYLAETDPAKSTRVKDLAALYRQAVAKVADPSLKTTADLLAR